MTIIGELDRRLSPLGWAPAEPWDDDEYVTYARRVDDQISYELGLDVEPRDWGFSLNPMIGVRHAQVAQLEARFLGVPMGACVTAAMLRDLVPDAGTRWMAEFADGAAEEAAVAERLVADLRDYGEPFLRARATLAAVIDRVGADDRRTQLDDAHLAIASALSGDSVAARRAIAGFEAKAVEKPMLARSQADRFLTAFREHFNLT